MIAKKKSIAMAVAGVLVGCMVGSGASVMLASEKAVADTASTTLVETYVNENVKIKNAPSVLCEITDSAVLESVKTAVANNTARPASVILQINENCQIVDNAGTALGGFGAFFSETLSGKIIPVVRVETQAAADALVTFLSTTEILDMAVVSNTPALVKSVRTAKPSVRGIVSCAQDAQLSALVKTANENLATTVILPSAKATAENVRYLQARMKSVWVTAENNSQITLNDCIQSGAYGVISSDFKAVYTAQESYGESLSRMPINVAYQTGKYFYNENSKLGAEKMIEKGANAVHMNARLTKDNEIVFMNDATIDRTSNGEGKVSNYTKEQLQEFELDLAEGENEPIPSFDDVISVVQEKNAVLWLQLNEDSTDMINALATELEEHDCYEQVVVLAKDTAILQVQSEIPQVSTALMSTMSLTLKKSEDPSVTISAEEQREYLKPQFETGFTNLIKDYPQYNANVLLAIDQSNEVAVQLAIDGIVQNSLIDRGICCFFNGVSRGLSNGEAYDTQSRAGVLGFMGNYAPYYQTKEACIIGKTETRPTLAVGDKVTVKVQNYDGTEIEASAKVFAVEDKGDSFVVVAVYESKLGLPMYTQSYTITKGEATEENANTENNQSGDTNDNKEEKNSKVWLFVGIGGGVVVVIGAIIAFVILKKRGEKEDEE